VCKWCDDGEMLDLTAGHNGGAWCFLDRELDRVDFIEQVTRSVNAGRVVEIFASNTPGNEGMHGARSGCDRLNGHSAATFDESGHVSPPPADPFPGRRRRA
jgi:hypothetical protein